MPLSRMVLLQDCQSKASLAPCVVQVIHVLPSAQGSCSSTYLCQSGRRQPTNGYLAWSHILLGRVYGNESSKLFTVRRNASSPTTRRRLRCSLAKEHGERANRNGTSLDIQWINQRFLFCPAKACGLVWHSGLATLFSGNSNHWL